jgi:hypothetical protein
VVGAVVVVVVVVAGAVVVLVVVVVVVAASLLQLASIMPTAKIITIDTKSSFFIAITPFQ